MPHPVGGALSWYAHVVLYWRPFDFCLHTQTQHVQQTCASDLKCLLQIGPIKKSCLSDDNYVKAASDIVPVFNTFDICPFSLVSQVQFGAAAALCHLDPPPSSGSSLQPSAKLPRSVLQLKVFLARGNDFIRGYETALSFLPGDLRPTFIFPFNLSFMLMHLPGIGSPFHYITCVQAHF